MPHISCLGVLVALAIELAGARQRTPGLEVRSNGTVQHRALWMPWVVAPGPGIGLRRRHGTRIGVGVRMPIRLGWCACAGNWHGSVPARTCCTDWVKQYDVATAPGAPPCRGMRWQPAARNRPKQSESAYPDSRWGHHSRNVIDQLRWRKQQRVQRGGGKDNRRCDNWAHAFGFPVLRLSPCSGS